MLEDRFVLREAKEPAQQTPPTLEQYIYVVQADTAFKIGISNNPQARIHTIRGCNPVEIEVVLLAKMPECSRETVEQIEKELHTMFANKQIRGEWFRLEPEDIEQIKAYLAEAAQKKGAFNSDGTRRLTARLWPLESEE